MNGYPPGADDQEILQIWRKHGVGSRQDETYAHDLIGEEDSENNCRPHGDPPCGGCNSCIHGQLSYSFSRMRATATLYAQSGLRWAPYVIDGWELSLGAVHHDSFACNLSGERPDGWPRYQPPVD